MTQVNSPPIRRAFRAASPPVHWIALALCWLTVAAGAPATVAPPHRTITAAATAAAAIVATLATDGAAPALALAQAESHLDDPRVQRNLAWATAQLPARLAPLGRAGTVEHTGTDRFLSSFVRFNYRVRYAGGDLRLMLTYRRKTAGWRLNQFYFDGAGE